MLDNCQRRAYYRVDGQTTTPKTEHDFTLVLTGITELTEQVESALSEAGCDDATLSTRCGRPYLTFSRLAPTLICSGGAGGRH